MALWISRRKLFHLWPKPGSFPQLCSWWSWRNPQLLLSSHPFHCSTEEWDEDEDDDDGLLLLSFSSEFHSSLWLFWCCSFCWSGPGAGWNPHQKRTKTTTTTEDSPLSGPWAESNDMKFERSDQKWKSLELSRGLLKGYTHASIKGRILAQIQAGSG